jgi:hypothetical protein
MAAVEVARVPRITTTSGNKTRLRVDFGVEGR